MRIQELTKKLIDAKIEENEAKREIKMLLEHFCNITEADLIMGKEISAEEFALLVEKVDIRVKERVPIQHIIGEAWFMGEYFKVSPDKFLGRV